MQGVQCFSGGGGGGGGLNQFFFFVIAIFDLVHNVEAILHLAWLLTAFGNMTDAHETEKISRSCLQLTKAIYSLHIVH